MARKPVPHRTTPVRRGSPRAFTLTEVLVVLGLIAMLVSLLLPLVGKARSAAQATNCLSNLREMGAAWTMYTAASRGQLMDYAWRVPAAPDLAWQAYWPGVLDAYGVRGDVLVCPAAREPTGAAAGKGYGNVEHAWTGRFSANGTAIRLNAAVYRDGSYGFNRYLTAGGGFGEDGLANKITAVRHTSEVPLFMDCAFLDTRPVNGSGEFPVDPPPNLKGQQVAPGAPEHWNFLLARHGRGINVAFADGSARWVGLSETYTLTWKADWVRYRLPLPGH